MISAFLADHPTSLLTFAQVSRRLREQVLGGPGDVAWSSLLAHMGYLEPEGSPRVGRRLQSRLCPCPYPLRDRSWMEHARQVFTADVDMLRRAVPASLRGGDEESQPAAGSLDALLQGRPRDVKDLWLHWFDDITPEFVAQVLRQCVNLKRLSVGSTRELAAVGFETGLEELLFMGELGVRPGFVVSASSFPALKRVSIASTSERDRGAVPQEAVLCGLPRLSELELTFFAPGVVNLAGSPALTELDLRMSGPVGLVGLNAAGLRDICVKSVGSEIQQLPPALEPERLSGVRSLDLRGVSLPGCLDLRTCAHLTDLRLDDCVFPKVVFGRNAKLESVVMQRCSIESVDVRRLRGPPCVRASLRELRDAEGFALVDRWLPNGDQGFASRPAAGAALRAPLRRAPGRAREP